MATPNYGYEKRQRELAKKKKKEEKLRAKAAVRHGSGDPASETPEAHNESGLPSDDATQQPG